MEHKTRRVGAGDCLLLIFGIIFLVGIRTVFAPCGPKEDGSWMTCHWAGQALTGTAAVLLVLALVHLLLRDRGMKVGLDVGIAVVAVFSALLPGKLIGLCMMPDMRCHQLMVPGATVCAVLMVLAAVLDIGLRRKKENGHDV